MNKEIELEEEYAVILLPKNSVEIKMNVKVFENSELMTVSKLMSLDDIREAFKQADEGYIDPDATYTLTDKGKSLAGLIADSL